MSNACLAASGGCALGQPGQDEVVFPHHPRFRTLPSEFDGKVSSADAVT
jgi:hypothetical protein